MNTMNNNNILQSLLLMNSQFKMIESQINNLISQIQNMGVFLNSDMLINNISFQILNFGINMLNLGIQNSNPIMKYNLKEQIDNIINQLTNFSNNITNNNMNTMNMNINNMNENIINNNSIKNFFFLYRSKPIPIICDDNKTIEELINKFLIRIGRNDLINNEDNYLTFIYNATKINTNEIKYNKLYEYFKFKDSTINVVERIV